MSFLARGVIEGERLPPEIAFLAAEGMEIRALLRAVALADRAGTDAATALLGAGLMEEEAFYRALARNLGAPFLDGAIRFGPGLHYPGCLTAGFAPLALGAGASCVLAPRGHAIRDLLGGGRGPVPAITTPTRLREAVYAACPGLVAAHAAEELRTCCPDRAVARDPAGRPLLLLGLAACAALSLFAALPSPMALAATLVGQALFLAMTLFRIAAIAIPPCREEAPPLPDRDLPVYTVLVALYREACVVPRIVRALAALDYPAAKLDIKFLIEAGDAGTAAALAKIPLPARFEIVTLPAGLPRTKPRALNAALPLVRGSLLVVYDAEDVPEPDQLRRAAALFAREPASTACLQGRLVIDNAADGPLTRLFALEYTGLFDVLNPALAALDLPIPLGGTSMHLRTPILRELHGWDAFNVTEDADLGVRLALAGYRVGDLPSSTFEEAPASLYPWLRQRTRWMKGFVQTSLVHGRHPLENLARLGPLEGLCALALLPGTVVSALAYPVCTALAGFAVVTGGLSPSPSFLGNLPLGLAITVFAAGLVAMAAPPLLGCHRRGWRDLLPFVACLPAYYCLLSLAALLALAEILYAPQRWNKTEHGLSRSSRSGSLWPVGRNARGRPAVDGT